jgi:hypothetical protein
VLVKKHLCVVVDYFPSRGTFLAIVKCKLMLVALNPMSSWFKYHFYCFKFPCSSFNHTESRDFSPNPDMVT